MIDFDTKSQQESSVWNAARIKDFYMVQTPQGEKDDCIEQGINQRIETKAHPLIDDILCKHTFPREEHWFEFISFVTLMYVRGPRFRQGMTEYLDHDIRERMDELHANEDTYRRGPLGSFTYEKSLEAYNKVRDSMFPVIKRNAYVDSMLRLARTYYPLFLQMTPNLIYRDVRTQDGFVTSDWPVIPIPTKAGLRPTNVASVDIDVYFPVSSQACVILNHDNVPKVWPVGRERVAYANYFQAMYCSRLIISQDQAFPWMRENRTISCDPAELISTFADLKKTQPLLKEYAGGKSRAKCLNDWSYLKGRD